MPSAYEHTCLSLEEILSLISNYFRTRSIITLIRSVDSRSFCLTFILLSYFLIVHCMS
jgi:hypothetical protein